MCKQSTFLTKKQKKKPIQCFKNRGNQIPELVGMKHIALETRKLATKLAQRKNSIICECL